MYTFSLLSVHEQCIIRNGILHYLSKATQVVNDNVMKNVESTVINHYSSFCGSKVKPLPYLVKQMIGLHTCSSCRHTHEH